MIEVFKTNVQDAHQARMLIDQIHMIFKDYIVNFDIDDCDKILRVESPKGFVDASSLMEMLRERGLSVQVLSDDMPVDEVF